ncbi:helix-turn-helix domain-containing protein [Flavobacterium sp.]|uniref:helix-turn-helix domain-containing protein n=1 Tax=Flavobacterium sp. TaxID=239 RepID=UPI0039E535AC
MTEKQVNRLVSNQLVKARELAGLTQKNVQEANIIVQSELSKIENGVKNISAAKLFLLANHYNQPIEFFFKNK